MSETYYKQCRMSKKGYDDRVGWIPEKFAQKGNFVKLKEDDGWRVEGVGANRLTQAQVMHISMEHTRHRKGDA